MLLNDEFKTSSTTIQGYGIAADARKCRARFKTSDRAFDRGCQSAYA
jgi:hypothetical protein